MPAEIFRETWPFQSDIKQMVCQIADWPRERAVWKVLMRYSLTLTLRAQRAILSISYARGSSLTSGRKFDTLGVT